MKRNLVLVFWNCTIHCLFSLSENNVGWKNNICHEKWLHNTFARKHCSKLIVETSLYTIS